MVIVAVVALVVVALVAAGLWRRKSQCRLLHRELCRVTTVVAAGHVNAGIGRCDVLLDVKADLRVRTRHVVVGSVVVNPSLSPSKRAVLYPSTLCSLINRSLKSGSSYECMGCVGNVDVVQTRPRRRPTARPVV